MVLDLLCTLVGQTDRRSCFLIEIVGFSSIKSISSFLAFSLAAFFFRLLRGSSSTEPWLWNFLTLIKIVAGNDGFISWNSSFQASITLNELCNSWYYSIMKILLSWSNLGMVSNNFQDIFLYAFNIQVKSYKMIYHMIINILK